MEKRLLERNAKKNPWDEHAKEEDCHHYSIICGSHGYINEKGKIIKLGEFQFDEIMKEIDWKPHEDY